MDESDPLFKGRLHRIEDQPPASCKISLVVEGSVSDGTTSIGSVETYFVDTDALADDRVEIWATDDELNVGRFALVAKASLAGRAQEEAIVDLIVGLWQGRRTPLHAFRRVRDRRGLSSEAVAMIEARLGDWNERHREAAAAAEAWYISMKRQSWAKQEEAGGAEGKVWPTTEQELETPVEDDEEINLEDAEENDDVEAESCPFCGQNSECAHHLATFDCTFSDEGKLGAGLGGGVLYEVEELHGLFECLGLTAYALAAARHAGHAPGCPAWLQSRPELRSYVKDLAAVIPDEEAPDDAVASGESELVSGGSRRRDVIRDLLDEAGVQVLISDREVDVPLYSSSYEIWWTDHAEAAARRLSELIVSIILERYTKNR